MIAVLLVESDTWSKLWDDDRHDIAVVQQNLERTATQEEFVQFRLDTFCGDVAQAWCELVNRLGRVLLDRESVGRSKPESPHNPQSILLEPVRRIAYTRNFIVPQGFLTTERVNQAIDFVVGHGVHGEVTSRQILSKTWCETHTVRVAAVRILTVNTERRDLVLFSGVAQTDRNCAMLNTGLDSLNIASRKSFQNLHGCCVGADVPIMRLQAEQAVSDAPAYHI